MDLHPHIVRRLGSLEESRFSTDDGATLTVQSFGRGPAVLFGNGIGVRYQGAVLQIEALRPRYRVVCWDYRGMGDSALPHPLADVSMARHGADAVAVLDHLGIDRCLYVGWSMGVQVGLEAIALAPERVAGFAPMMGTYTRPFRTGFPAAVGAGIEAVFTLGERLPVVPQRLLDLAVGLPRVATRVLRASTFISARTDPEVFLANVRNVHAVDKRIYMRTMMALAHHDAEALLPRVRCPTMVICGQRDYVTPVRMARRMAAGIAGARYREVAGGSHFALIEHAELINGWLLDLAEEVLPVPAPVDPPPPA